VEAWEAVKSYRLVRGLRRMIKKIWKMCFMIRVIENAREIMEGKIHCKSVG
jgi:hypothetical protein